MEYEEDWLLIIQATCRAHHLSFVQDANSKTDLSVSTVPIGRNHPCDKWPCLRSCFVMSRLYADAHSEENREERWTSVSLYSLKPLQAHEEEIGIKKIYKEETLVVDQPGHL